MDINILETNKHFHKRYNNGIESFFELEIVDLDK